MKKKIFIMFASVLMLVALTFSLTACGGVAGTYKLEELCVTENGKVISAKAGENLLLESGTWTYPVDKDDFVLKLNKDGTYTVSMRLPNIDFTHWEGKWEEKDGKINILDDDGEVTATYTVDGNRIVWEVEGFKITLKK